MTPRVLSVPERVACLAASLRARVDDLASLLVTEILRLEPEYGGVVSEEDLWQSCCSNLASVIDELRDPQNTPEVLAPARATGSRRAEQGLPLESLLHSYRLGGKVVWQGLTVQARTTGAEDVEALLDAATHVWDVIDAFSSAVASAYRQTESVLAGRREERARTLVDALLEGRGSERGVRREAAAILDLPEQGPFVVVVSDATGHTNASSVPSLSFGWRSGWRMRADRDVGLVALESGTVEDLLEDLQARVSGRAGVSTVVEGMAGIGEAHHQAELALRTLAGGRTGVAFLPERLPAALVADSRSLGALLIKRRLDRLTGLPDDEALMLVETLRTYLDCGGSSLLAARGLYCHRNTVLKRLRRVELLIGGSLTDATVLLETQLALESLLQEQSQ